MSINQLLLTIDQEMNGYVTSKKLLELGFSYYDIHKMTKNNQLAKSERGVFVLPERLDDSFFNAWYRYQKGIFSRNTALYLQNLSNRTPIDFDMSFPRSYNTQQIRTSTISPLRESERTFGVGAIEIKTPAGNIVKCYSVERTLCDIVRKSNMLDTQIISEAFKFYARIKNKELDKLIKYARLLNVEDNIRTRMEVLL